MKKALLLGALVAATYLVSFNVAAQATSFSPYDVPDYSRDFHMGYFTDNQDDWGDYVLQNNANDGYGHWNGSGYDAIPPSVNTANEFIAFIEGKLNSNRVDFSTANNATNWDRTGAAFIIQTMIGSSRNRPPTSGEIAEWESRVRHAEAMGNMRPGDLCTGSPNTYYQIARGDGGNYLNDVAWYNDGRCGSAILFYKDNGALAYTLYRQCANPLGKLDPLTDDSWSAWGRTTVTDDDGAAAGDTATEISVRPGATLNFKHEITNNGPANAGIWYALWGRNSGTSAVGSYTGEYYNNVSLSGAPVFTRTDKNIAFDWGTGSPGAGIPTDNFSVRWTKTDNFTAGNYWFTIVGDDGVRLYIDGVLRLDAWIAQGATSYTYQTALTAGNHTIKMEYFESGGPGYSRLDYSNANTLGGTNSGSYTPGQTKTFNETIPVPATATGGAQICSRIQWSWKNSAGIGDYGWNHDGIGYQACATVQGSFNLQPSVVPSTTIAQQGDTVTFTYTVKNAGSSGANSITCSIAATQPPGTPAPPGASCPTIASGATVPATAAPESITIGTQPAGSSICRTLTANPGSSGGGPASSPQACIRIGKKPYVHFKGSDVWAGGGILSGGTCTTNTNAKITTSSNLSSSAGSVVEYGAFALSDITKFGSGNKPLYNSGDFADLGRRLSFANNTTNIGRFGAPQHCINDYSAQFDNLPVGGALPITSSISGAWHSDSFPSLSGTAPAGVTKVYYSDHDVTITGDIKYPDTYGGVNEIPSIVVIAKGNIYVDPGVRRMDGIYITRQTFFTCYPKPSPPTNSTCATQLTVNGAVIANSLDLYRTFGGDGATTAARQTPAEIFNFSTELFLRNVLNSNNSQSISTSETRELPPRF